jgi:hypothetical protein
VTAQVVGPGGTIEAPDVVAAVEDVARGISDYETRLDYDVRVDEQPVFIGRAPAGAATADDVWTVEKLTYDGSSRPTRKQVFIDVAWDDRAGL